MSNIAKFIQIFNEIEGFLKNKETASDEYIPFTTLIRNSNNPIVTAKYHELKQFADLRNILSHSSESLIEPTDQAILKIEEIKNSLVSPINAYDKFAVKKSEIFTAKLDDPVIQVIGAMNKNIFTHVPIISEKDSLLGVFSEETLLSYIASKQEIIIDKTVKVKDFEEFIPIEKHLSEYFEFISRRADAYQVEELFQNYIKKEQRLGMIFVTDNGKKEEKILGIITAWDLFKKE